MSTTDLTGPVHKALRGFMCEVLVQTGALDVTRRDEIERTLDLVTRLLGVLRAPAPALRAAMAELLHAAAGERAAHAAAVYRELAAFVGKELLRLHAAEADLPPAADDGAAAARRRRQRLARLDGAEVDDMIGWMADTLTPQELSTMLEDLRAAASPALYAHGLAKLGRRLSPERWQRLSLPCPLAVAA